MLGVCLSGHFEVLGACLSGCFEVLGVCLSGCFGVPLVVFELCDKCFVSLVLKRLPCFAFGEILSVTCAMWGWCLLLILAGEVSLSSRCLPLRFRAVFNLSMLNCLKDSAGWPRAYLELLRLSLAGV